MLRPGKTLNSVHMLTLRNPVVMVGGLLLVDFCFVFIWDGPLVDLPCPIGRGDPLVDPVFKGILRGVTCFTAFC